ncbi:hypothetical protein NMY22_g9546 [Coprinellus aureogranulatus]|nr:hypothetical protein NMY22_g9546 [Coprinellus aureogranulatus]
MNVSEDQVRALASTVAAWRLAEYIYISFYALYIYYVLTTVEEEASVISPQKWNRGKILFLVIRYGALAQIALQLMRDNRTYLVVSPNGCKAWLIVCTVILYLFTCACDGALALCLGALLQVTKTHLLVIILLSMGIRIVGAVIDVASAVQYPAEPVSVLDKELGYPCYVPSSGDWIEMTLAGLGRDVRAYLHFATTAAILLLAGATLIVRYKGHKGRLIQVLRRDGGLYYIIFAGMRFGMALTDTPAIMTIVVVRYKDEL